MVRRGGWKSAGKANVVSCLVVGQHGDKTKIDQPDAPAAGPAC
jgi:hypothetical protein